MIIKPFLLGRMENNDQRMSVLNCSSLLLNQNHWPLTKEEEEETRATEAALEDMANKLEIDCKLLLSYSWCYTEGDYYLYFDMNGERFPSRVPTGVFIQHLIWDARSEFNSTIQELTSLIQSRLWFN